MSLRTASFDLKVRIAGGRAYAQFLEDSRRAETSTRDELEHRSALAACRMAAYAAQRTDWYAKAYADAGLRPQDLVDDPTLFAHLPLVDKGDVRDHFEQFLARDSGVRRTVEAHTGGSTGQPLRVLRDATVGPAAQSWRLFGWWGVHPSDDMALVVRDQSRGLRRAVEDARWWPARRVHLDVAAMDVARMRAFVEDCRRVRPRLVVGYAAALHELARVVLDGGWDFPSPVAVSATASPLTPSQRRDVTEALGAPVYDTFRAAEVGYLAGQCERLDGLHVLADQRLLEVVDDAGRPVPAGVPGDVVVTDLSNRAFPLVRYRLGDVAAWSSTSCPCGRPFPLLSHVAGRTNDVVRMPSGRVSVYSFVDLLLQHPCVRQYQLHQLEDHSFRVDVVPTSTEVREEHLEPLCRSLEGRLGGEVPVRVRLVPEIRHERGKSKTVVSHLP